MESRDATARDWGWVFHVLTKGPSTNRVKVPLPDTILFKDSEPCRWVFTAKSGHVMSRSGNKLKLAKMKRRLCSKVGLDEEEDSIPVCLLRKGDSISPTVSYLSPAELAKFCVPEDGGVRGGTIAVQDFVDAAHPIAFRCVYTRCGGGEGHARGFQFATYKINTVSEATKRIMSKTGGIEEGMEVVKSQMTEANALVEGITFRICRYIESSLPLRVLTMSAEFVLDDYGQAWFTHSSELLTVPREKKWKPESGNTSLFEKSPSLEAKLQKPHRVRVQPGKDGVKYCAGDHCTDTVYNAEIEGGEDLTKYTNENPTSQAAESKKNGGKSSSKNVPSGKAVATHAVLYKSIYLARLERKEKDGVACVEDPVSGVFGRLQAQIGHKTRLGAEGELQARCMPQLIPTYASKHSLTDYYDMVPVCQACSKVYLYLDKVRTGVEEPEQSPLPEPPKSPLLGNVMDMLASVEEEVDGTAAGIRERLMDMYSTAAKAPPKEDKKVVLNTGPLLEGSTEVSRLLKMSRSKKGQKTDEDYEKMFALDAPKKRSKSSLGTKIGRLPNVRKHEEGAFPRSKTSMDGSIAKASRGIGGKKHTTLPRI